MQRFKLPFIGNAVPADDGDFYLVADADRRIQEMQKSINSALRERDTYFAHLEQAEKRYEAVVAELEEAQQQLNALQPKPAPMWDHIQIDDPVIVWNNVGDDRRYSRHFAGVDKLDKLPLTWRDGRTSWSSPDGRQEEWDNCQKASDFKSVNAYLAEPQTEPLNDYVVLYTIPGISVPGDTPYIFTCKATNGYHATTHCLNAISGIAVVSVHEGTDIDEAVRKYNEPNM
jgi:hypothetical protein